MSDTKVLKLVPKGTAKASEAPTTVPAMVPTPVPAPAQAIEERRPPKPIFRPAPITKFEAAPLPKPEPAPPVAKPAGAPEGRRRRGRNERRARGERSEQPQPRLSREQVLQMYRTMYLSRRLDDKENQHKHQE